MGLDITLEFLLVWWINELIISPRLDLGHKCATKSALSIRKFHYRISIRYRISLGYRTILRALIENGSGV